MKIIQDLQDMINEMELNQQPINEIAHYTSMEALKSILEGIRMPGTNIILRATSALKTDDREELQEGYDFLMNMLSYIEDGKTKKFRLTNYMDDVRSCDKTKHLSEEEIKRWFFSGIRTPYIVCFSRHVNELSIWQKSYGRNGEGACLVFDFSAMVYENELLNINVPFPIIYGERLGYVNFKNMFYDLIRWEYNDFIDKVDRLSNSCEITSQKLQSIEEICGFISSFFKRDKWHDQQEVRIMCTTKEENSSCVKENEKGQKYVEVPVPITCLKKVILGPKVNDSYVDEIRERLQLYSFRNEDVFKSREPLQ